MPDKTFVDTNILVYAHDHSAGDKHEIAGRKVEDLWSHRAGVLSLQVLQEFYVTLTQKIASPLPSKTVRDVVEQYGAWEVVVPEMKDLLSAIELQKKHQFSFWDALIVQAALRADCRILLTEDFQQGRKIGSLTIQNPFDESKS